MERWWSQLLKIDVDVKHQAGVKHKAADALWRVLTDVTDKTVLKEDVPAMMQNNVDGDKGHCPKGRLEDNSTTSIDIRNPANNENCRR